MKTDILFISIQKQDSPAKGKFRAPPLGQLQLCSYLREGGFTPAILDVGEKDTELAGKVLSRIREEKPAVIGLSITTPLFNPAIRIARLIKENFRDMPVIAGGPHPTVRPDEVLQTGFVDIAVKGEGEMPLLGLMKAYRKSPAGFGSRLKKVPGLVFMDRGRLVDSGQSRVIEDLDSLPLPARDLIDIRDYEPLPNQYRNLPVVHIVTSRGCPFGCRFCSNIFGQRLRQRSAKSVLDEIRQCVRDLDAREVYFYDDTLTANRKWVRSLCEGLIEENIKVSWSCFARIDTVDRETLDLMRKAGCWNIFYGIEAGYQECLDRIFKNITLDRIRSAIDMTRDAGIEIRASFMLGFPWESPKEGMKTIQFAKSLDIEYAQFNLFTPFPGIPLLEEAKKSGTLDMNKNRYDLWAPSYVPRLYRSRKALVNLQKTGFRQFYMRPSHILKMAGKLRSTGDLVRQLKGAYYLLRNY